MKKLIQAICFACAGVMALVFTSCETESVKNNDVNITPISIGLHINEYADFTASGGFDYTWSLSNPTWGVLSATTGPTVRYTDRYDPGSNANASAVQVLTVTSTIEGASSSSTSTSTSTSNTVTTTVTANTATAQIEHLPTSSIAGGDTNSGTITVTSSVSSMTSNSTAIFTASGGTSPYTWSILPTTTTYGTLSELSANQEEFLDEYYPASSNGVSVTIYVTDSTGATGDLGLQLNQ